MTKSLARQNPLQRYLSLLGPRNRFTTFASLKCIEYVTETEPGLY